MWFLWLHHERVVTLSFFLCVTHNAKVQCQITCSTENKISGEEKTTTDALAIEKTEFVTHTHTSTVHLLSIKINKRKVNEPWKTDSQAPVLIILDFSYY